ncbi:MAG TPA: hypothetical protein VMT64_01300 [Candidatus Binataceae bacterium]|nr:hypothetical protein [Candidatus Binataceae bacterium]
MWTSTARSPNATAVGGSSETFGAGDTYLSQQWCNGGSTAAG